MPFVPLIGRLWILAVRGKFDHVTGHRHISVARCFCKAGGRGLGGATLAYSVLALICM